MPQTLVPTSPVPEPPRGEDPYPYGWRNVCRPTAEGGEECDRQPLTLEDSLHPQEGDVIPEIPRHNLECQYLAEAIRAKNHHRAGFLVLRDCLVDWGVAGLRNPSPDVSVFGELNVEPDLTLGTFRLAPSGGRCVLAFEDVSPNTRPNDVVHKFREYYQAGVPLYVLVDQERTGGPRRLVGYRRTPSGYELLPLDAQGRLFLDPVGVWLQLRDEGLVCFDADTGEEIGNYVAERLGRKAEAEARQAAEQRVHAEAEARQAAEQRVHAEAEARQAAEQRERAEAEARRAEAGARRAAEQRERAEAEARRAEAEARRAAEQRERAEAEARRAAEQRLQELEAELRRLRGDKDS